MGETAMEAIWNAVTALPIQDVLFSVDLTEVTQCEQLGIPVLSELPELTGVAEEHSGMPRLPARFRRGLGRDLRLLLQGGVGRPEIC